jgi:hypothetical protein
VQSTDRHGATGIALAFSFKTAARGTIYTIDCYKVELGLIATHERLHEYL